ncbi:putative auxin efflux carrier component 3b [Hordeum vulgare]|nr:putative auxin efflux carrier component 3b [Hordeum vulgare]
MISWHDLYTVLAAVVPLYVAMILAYGSVRWWGVITADQCAGINRFVAVFAVPLLSFKFISGSDLYAMDLRFAAADTLQKLIILAALAVWSRLPLPFPSGGGLDWSITLFSFATLPNTLIMGIPLLVGMYGRHAGDLMVQLIVLQCIIWYTLLLFLFEFRAARLLISGRFPAAAVADVAVDPDVTSLDSSHAEAQAHVAPDGSMRVVVRRSTASLSRRSLLNDTVAGMSSPPRASNLTGVEFYSVTSSRNHSSSFTHDDFSATTGGGGAAATLSPLRVSSRANLLSLHTSWQQTLMPLARYDEHAPRGRSAAVVAPVDDSMDNLHMYDWSSGASGASEGSGLPVFGNGAKDSGRRRATSDALSINSDSSRLNRPGTTDGERAKSEAAAQDSLERLEAGTEATEKEQDQTTKDGSEVGGPPASVMVRLILTMVWRRLIRNPNTYASVVGLVWSLIEFRYHVTMPTIVANSISILSNAGLGMAMFSLGLFMAMQPKLIACGNSIAASTMAVRFLLGPAVMAAASVAVGLRGTLLRIAIVQAALPQGIVPFVFAKEYNLHAAILCTGVIFGMLIALPIVMVYYIILGLL